MSVQLSDVFEPTLQQSSMLPALPTIKVVDSNCLAAFERLATYAAGVASADVTALGFVDEDYLFFAGSFGIERQRWERDGSFFDAVAQSGDSLLVADALHDQRFSDHSLTRGPTAIRSFAGAPVIDQNGLVLGALGAMSRAPSSFGPQTVADMSALARSVQRFMAELPEGRTEPQLVQGWLGIRTVRAGSGSARSGRGGLIVVSVRSGSPAEQAGLRAADILGSIDGVALYRSSDVTAALAKRMAGSVALLRVQRGGEWLDVYVTVEKRRSPLVALRAS